MNNIKSSKLKFSKSSKIKVQRHGADPFSKEHPLKLVAKYIPYSDMINDKKVGFIKMTEFINEKLVKDKNRVFGPVKKISLNSGIKRIKKG